MQCFSQTHIIPIFRSFKSDKMIHTILLQFLKQVNALYIFCFAGDKELILTSFIKNEGTFLISWSQVIFKNLTWDELLHNIIDEFSPIRTLDTIINNNVYRLQRPHETFRDVANDNKQTV